MSIFELLILKPHEGSDMEPAWRAQAEAAR